MNNRAELAAAAAADLTVVSDECLRQWQIINSDICKLERDCSTDNAISAGIRHLVHHLTDEQID